MIYGFWISLDYPDLSVEEALTLLKAYGGKIKYSRRIGRLLIVDTDVNIKTVRHIILRSASIREGFKIYQIIRSEFFENTFSPDLYEDVFSSHSLAIKVLKYNSSLYSSLDSNTLAKEISAKLLRDYKGNIDLKNPEKRFTFIFADNLVISSLEIIGRHSKGFSKRTPGNKPVFSPFSLNPKLARIMVNLSGAVEGELILDPFCGVGGISVETSILNMESICIELIYRWIKGSLKNVRWLDKSKKYFEGVCGDSANLFIRKADYVVTDPPYGRITSIGIYSDANHILKNFLSYLSSVDGLKRIVFMYPKSHKIDFEKYNLGEKSRFIIPVHGGLTRVLRVVERKQ